MTRSPQASASDPDKRYSSEAVQRILELAMAGDSTQSFSRQQLWEMAAELSIAPQVLEQAEQTWQKQYQQQQRRERWHRYLRAQWLVFGLVNSGLIVINLVTYSAVFWAIYPLLGWGISLGIMSLIPGSFPPSHRWQFGFCQPRTRGWI